jgi:uncharacterized protein with ParB-like and HNH nuclease domain
MPLNANVVSLEELLLKYPVFDVPNYQRSFRWTDEAITNLFQDILNGLEFKNENDKRGHFLGSIVVCKDKANSTIDLVDGQQRLTTLTIMLWSLAKLADKETRSRAKKCILQKNKKDPRILHKIGNREIYSDRDAYKIVSVSDNDDSAEIPDEDITPILDTELNALQLNSIYKAGKCLDKLAKQACKSYIDTEKRKLTESKAAAEIYSKIADGIKLIIIETDQRKEGMRVFASINAGGTKLEPWELVMSAFYTHGPTEEQQKMVQLVFEHDTRSISKVLGGSDFDDSAINNGLRTYWLATQRFARMDDLFNEFNESLANAQNPTKFHYNSLLQILFCTPILKGFETASDKVTCIDNKSFDMSCVHPLTVAMKDKLARPILLSTLLHFKDNPKQAFDALRRVSYALERARMRLIICKYGANFIEKPYSNLAIEIYRGKHKGSPEDLEEAVYTYLKGISGFPSQDELEQAFKRFNPFGRDQKLTRLITSRLNDAIRHPKKIHSFFENTPAKNNSLFNSLQGFNYPENADDNYANDLGFRSLADLENLTSTLGNLFMANPKTGKIEADYALNDVEVSELNQETIKERRDSLAEIATRIWHF